MTNDPKQPEQSQLATDRHNLGFPPNPENPSGVRAGLSSSGEINLFPRAAVETLRLDVRNAIGEPELIVLRPVLEEVLGWIDRFVPQALPGCTVEPAAVGAIQMLVIENTDLEDLDLVRVDGRAFVPETPAIEFEGPFTADSCQLWEDGDPSGAAVFSSDGEPFCMVDGATVIGGDPMPRAVAIARLLNEAAEGLADEDTRRELRGILADCSGFLGEPTSALQLPENLAAQARQLADRCESMLAQVVAGEAEDHNPDRFVHASPEVAAVIGAAVEEAIERGTLTGLRPSATIVDDPAGELLLTPEMERPCSANACDDEFPS